MILYRLGGVRIGSGSTILGPLRLWGRSQLTIGVRSSITTPCAINLDADVTIGNGVYIGNDTRILTVSHKIGPAKCRASGGRSAQPVIIENGVWIAANVTILPGVTVGAGSVVASGATVTKDVPPNTLVAGVPAKVIRNLE